MPRLLWKTHDDDVDDDNGISRNFLFCFDESISFSFAVSISDWYIDCLKNHVQAIRSLRLVYTRCARIQTILVIMNEKKVA